MSMVLKLVALKTYVSPATQGIIMQKGESARFSDVHSGLMLKSKRTNGDNERVCYWEEAEHLVPTYDFSGDVVVEAGVLVVAPVAALPAAPVALPISVAKPNQRTRATRAS